MMVRERAVRVVVGVGEVSPLAIEEIFERDIGQFAEEVIVSGCEVEEVEQDADISHERFVYDGKPDIDGLDPGWFHCGTVEEIKQIAKVLDLGKP
jgi:hypothetical protein